MSWRIQKIQDRAVSSHIFLLRKDFSLSLFLFQVIFRSETGGATTPKNTISTKQAIGINADLAHWR